MKKIKQKGVSFMAKQKKWKDKYEVLSELGEGGNAKVYQVRLKESGEIYALKELQAGGREKKGRFADEINIIIENSEEIEGIIPIIEYSFDEYWYTMPIAKPIVQFIIERKLTIRDIVDGTIQLCSTLEKLHEKGVSHNRRGLTLLQNLKIKKVKTGFCIYIMKLHLVILINLLCKHSNCLK